MKNLRDLIKKIVAHTAIVSLLQTSFVFSAHAASYDSIEQTGKEVTQVLGAAVQTFGQVKMQQMSMQQQLAQQVQNAKLMSQLSPNCRKADGTLCYVTTGKLFPECPLPASMATIPQNVCSETLQNPQQSAAQISSMDNYEAIANNWINHYDQMLNVAANTSAPIGLKCIEEKKKAVDSQLTEMVNNLTRLQDQLNKDKETFKANNKKILEDIALANDELFGDSGTKKNNLKLKTADFSKYFSQNCQSVIGEQGMAAAPKEGLNAVLQFVSPMNKRAADFNSNKASIENEVRAEITKIQTAIKNGGLQEYLDKKDADPSKFQSLNFAAAKQATELKNAKERIAKELAKVGYELPVMDKNFSKDFGEEISNISSSFQTRYVNGCTTGANNVGIAIPLQQILDRMEQTNGTQGAKNQYRAAIINAMNSGGSMERIVTNLQGLEASTYKGMSVTYQDGEGQNITSTPATILAETYKRCEASYANNEKKKSVRAENLMREYKNLHDAYATNLSSKALEQVLNCNGETKKSGASCGAPEAYDHTSKNFCISHAQQCASEVNGCYAEATKLVETRKAKMESLAKTFNANAAGLVARANQLYTAQKTAVMDLIKVYQTRFPGTNFEIPENMFVSMPELKSDAFGIPLAGDGNMAFMDELPKKLDLMKKMFRTQQEKIDGEIQDYIAKQSEAMEKQKDRWKQFGDQCKSMAASIRKDLNKYNADGMKAQQQLDNKVGVFCKKYSDLKSNPLSACNNNPQKLAEDADAIAARLSNNSQYITTQFRNVCNQYNNESSSALESCIDMDASDKKVSASKKRMCDALFKSEEKRLAAEGITAPSKKIRFSSLCKGEDTSDSDLITAIGRNLPEKDRKILEDIKDRDQLKEKLDQLSASSQDFFDELESITGKADGMCSKLSEYNKVDIKNFSTKKEIAEHYEKLGTEAMRVPTSIPKVETKEPTANTGTTTTSEASGKAATTTLVKDPRLEELRGKVADLAKEKEAALKKWDFNELIASLTPTLSQEDVKISKLERIGEQADQSCDAQNTVQQAAPKSFADTILDAERASSLKK